jgi:site-specific recombinase XerD
MMALPSRSSQLKISPNAAEPAFAFHKFFPQAVILSEAKGVEGPTSGKLDSCNEFQNPDTGSLTACSYPVQHHFETAGLASVAYEWRETERVPRIRLLIAERVQDFVLSRKQEETCLAGCRQPPQRIAILMLETGLRIGEALHLEWADVTLVPVNGALFGFLRVREGKSKNARHIVPLTDRAAALLWEREAAKSSGFIFANPEGKPYPGTSIHHLHRDTVAPKVDGNRTPIFPGDFVLHSLRHTMLTRLGESGVDAFTIVRIAGHGSIAVSQRYIHPTPEAVERAFERLQLSGDFAVIEPKRLPPATVSATLAGTVAVSH